MNIDKIKLIIDQYTIDFLNLVKDKCSRPVLINFNNTSIGFFHPSSKEYFLSEYYEIKLEHWIQDKFMHELLIEMLCEAELNVEEVEHSHHNPHERYTEDSSLSFIITNSSVRIGYKNVSLACDDLEIEELRCKYQLDKIKIISWEDNKRMSCVDDTITIQDFFSMYFPLEVFEYYSSRVKITVEEAIKYIGYHTIPDLSYRHLSNLRIQTIDMLKQFDLSTNLYQEFNGEGKPTDKFHAPLERNDIKIINENCFAKNLCAALVGWKEFARCFITSEYLYSVFKTGECHCFDYTSIVSGYFKSVELLLNTLVTATLDLPESENLWIKTKRTTKIKEDEKNNYKKRTTNNGNVIKLVRFKRSNIEHFSTEMGPLIYFVRDNKEGWVISDNGVGEVFRNLNNYCFGCRNQHFHKDIIDTIEQVEIIRKNTIICLLQLIGGYKYFSTEAEATEILDVRDYSYNKIYNAMLEIPKGEMKYIIKYENGREVQVYRPLNQERTEYDDLGIITTPIRFIKSDNFSDYDEFANGTLKNDEIQLTRENTNVKIWRVSRSGQKIEILW